MHSPRPTVKSLKKSKLAEVSSGESHRLTFAAAAAVIIHFDHLIASDRVPNRHNSYKTKIQGTGARQRMHKKTKKKKEKKTATKTEKKKKKKKN